MTSRQRPDIIISSLDVYRLYNLMDALPPDAFAGKDEMIHDLARARVVAPTDMPPNVVTMNSTVRYIVRPSRKVIEHTLVYPEREGTAGNLLSIFTPVGSALLGLSEGDEIAWPGPDGKKLRIKVLEILYQPERAGEFQV